jgi:signal transduction histidine kinase
MQRTKKRRKKSATASAKAQHQKVAFLSNVNNQITLARGLRAMSDISKIENGTFSVAPTTVRIADLIQDQVSEIAPHAERKGINLLCEIEDPEIKVTIDSYCLSNALENLLDNALNYTDNGHILVRLSVHQDRFMRIEVEDTGRGIASKDLRVLFQPFSQRSVHPERSGMGLGLALAKRYLALNGARLSVKSEKSRGSVFTIHLRIANPPA